MSDPLLEEPKPSKSIMRTLRNSFLTGLVVTGPIGITILLITWFIGLLDSWFTPLIPSQFQPSEYLPFDVPGIGVILALIIVFIVGALTTNFFGRSLVKFGENLISQTPIAGTIYNALRQILRRLLRTANALSHRSFWLNTRGKTVGPWVLLPMISKGKLLILWAMRLYLSLCRQRQTRPPDFFCSMHAKMCAFWTCR